MPDNNQTVLGLEFLADENDPIFKLTPLCAIVVVKGLDPDGNVRHCIGVTSDITMVEGLGLAEYLRLKIRNSLLAADLDDN